MPAHLRSVDNGGTSRDPEADCMVILLAAHDLGLNTTTALRHVSPIEGKMSMSAELMRMLVRRDGHELWVEIDRDDAGRVTGATAKGVRKEFPERTIEATFTIADAVDAQLCRIDDEGYVRARSSSNRPKPWESYTEDMLVARATSRWCRRYGEDCLMGVSYTPEELGSINVENEAHNDAYEAAAPEVLAEFGSRIAALAAHGDEYVAKVREAWKAAGVRPLRATEKNPRVVSVNEVPIVERIIAAAEAEIPAEAEVVPEGEKLPELTTEERVRAFGTKQVHAQLADLDALPEDFESLPLHALQDVLVAVLDERETCETCGGIKAGKVRTEEEICSCPM
jgi:hypothetical protein